MMDQSSTDIANVYLSLNGMAAEQMGYLLLSVYVEADDQGSHEVREWNSFIR